MDIRRGKPEVIILLLQSISIDSVEMVRLLVLAPSVASGTDLTDF